jgi:hypothetical protein
MGLAPGTKDADFIADIQKLNVELDPLPGDAHAGS